MVNSTTRRHCDLVAIVLVPQWPSWFDNAHTTLVLVRDLIVAPRRHGDCCCRTHCRRQTIVPAKQWLGGSPSFTDALAAFVWNSRLTGLARTQYVQYEMNETAIKAARDLDETDETRSD